MTTPDLAETLRLAEQFHLIPISTSLPADADSPVRAFLQLRSPRDAFLLESVEGGEQLARYSMIGYEPVRTVTLHADRAVIRDARRGVREERCDDPLAVLGRETMSRTVAPLDGGEARFSGGAVGWLGYELATCYERLPVAPRDPLGVPLGWFGIFDTVIVIDHAAASMRLITHVDRDDASGVEAAHAAAVARLSALRTRLSTPVDIPAVVIDPGARPRHDIPANRTREDLIGAVRRCKEHILAGDIFQVQVSRRFSTPLHVAPFDLYRMLRALNPIPYMFFLDTPECTIAGASPELLVRVEGGAIDYHPIAGTRPRGATSELDSAMEQELRHSEKERAEHLMLVDLGRNDVGRVAETGSVKVTEFMEVERYSHVMHLVSHITARLDRDRTALDALRACFPAGTVTGAPKIRAMEIIAEEEPDRRGVYAGSVGYLDFHGNLDTAIALRTVVVRNGIAHAQAAAGIVADSDAEQEALEIDNKVAAPLLAIDLANGVGA